MEKIKNAIQELKERGFKGFTTIKELKRDFSCGNIPHTSGVYIVLYPTTEHPQFMERGTGGFFKDKNPDVSIEKLQAKWVENEAVIYIGKAEDLNNRVKQYIDFGSGKPVGHYGGRYIWQIERCITILKLYHLQNRFLPSRGGNEPWQSTTD